MPHWSLAVFLSSCDFDFYKRIMTQILWIVDFLNTNDGSSVSQTRSYRLFSIWEVNTGFPISCSNKSGDCNSVGTYCEVKNVLYNMSSAPFKQSSRHCSSLQTWIWNRAFILPKFSRGLDDHLQYRKEWGVLAVTCLSREIMERTRAARNYPEGMKGGRSSLAGWSG